MAPPKKKVAVVSKRVAKGTRKEPKEAKLKTKTKAKQPVAVPKSIPGAARAKKVKLTLNEYLPQHRAKFILTCGEGEQVCRNKY
jgi:hypothetical protein